MEILVTVGLILLSLSILIVIHEFGHYWAARMFGIRVERFYLFFDYKFSLFKYKRGDTEWGIGWIPLGGYVKIAGMVDESMDQNAVAAPPKPDEYGSKPVWQRLIVMLGGVIMNVVLGILLFIGLKFFIGDFEIPHGASATGLWKPQDGIWVNDSTSAWKLGFRTGDEVVGFDGEPLRSFSALCDVSLLINEGSAYQIRRGGKDTSITIPEGFFSEFMDKDRGERTLFMPDMAPVLIVLDTTGLQAGLEKAAKATKPEDKLDTTAWSIQAWRAGLRTGDRVVRIDSTPITRFSEIGAYTKTRHDSVIAVTVQRDGKELPPMALRLKENGKLGILPNIDTLRVNIAYSFGEAIPAGVSSAFKVVTDNLKGLAGMFTGKVNAAKSVSGPIGIAKVLKTGFDAGGWSMFWRITAMLSMVLAVMNLLPIPVLDGGQIVILLIESIIGREIPPKAKGIIIYVGLIMVLGIMLFAVFNDIFK